jgi:hypothetical protein
MTRTCFVFLTISFCPKLFSYETTSFWKLFFLVVYIATLSVLALCSIDDSEYSTFDGVRIGSVNQSAERKPASLLAFFFLP